MGVIIIPVFTSLNESFIPSLFIIRYFSDCKITTNIVNNMQIFYVKKHIFPYFIHKSLIINELGMTLLPFYFVSKRFESFFSK